MLLIGLFGNSQNGQLWSHTMATSTYLKASRSFHTTHSVTCLTAKWFASTSSTPLSTSRRTCHTASPWRNSTCFVNNQMSRNSRANSTTIFISDQYLFVEMLELVDFNLNAANDPSGCPQFHFFPRFVRELPGLMRNVRLISIMNMLFFQRMVFPFCPWVRWWSTFWSKMFPWWTKKIYWTIWTCRKLIGWTLPTKWKVVFWKVYKHTVSFKLLQVTLLPTLEWNQARWELINWTGRKSKKTFWPTRRLFISAFAHLSSAMLATQSNKSLNIL